MSDKDTDKWATYYEQTRKNPPSKLLTEALQYVADKRNALDAGAGALKDSRYLLEMGFEVIAFDPAPTFSQEVKSITSPKFHPIFTSFEDYEYPEHTFDLVVAMNSLPFVANNLDSIVQNLISTMKSGGIFCGTFFGPHDEWNQPNSGKSFRTQAQVKDLFADMSLLVCREEENDRPTAAGVAKHWHLISVIAKAK